MKDLKKGLFAFYKKVKKKRINTFFAISLLLHFFIFVLNFHPSFLNMSDEKIQKKKYFKVSLTDKNIQELKKKFKKNDNQKKQIVNNELLGKEEKPEDSRFLGEKNQKYDRQTIAHKIDTFKKAGHGKKVAQQKQKNPKKDDGKSLNLQKNKKEIDLKDLSFASSKYDEFNKFKRKEKVDLGLENIESDNEGLAANNDFIEDIPVGDVTHLNTVEFKYFGFYDRIRKKLEQYWGFSLRQKAKKMYHEGRKLIPGENYVTSLKITLDKNGNILSVNIMSASGSRELDSAAVESFNKAGPFPNPPKGMLKDEIAVIEWGFVVKS